MNNTSPLVSQILPVYVQDRKNIDYFGEALESVLNQTYKNMEFIVINDGSPLTAELEVFLRPYMERIRYIKKENGGVATALNRGIEEMKGEYFSWLSHDDWFYPQKIETQIAQILQEDNNTILYCDVEHVDDQMKHLSFEYNPDLDPQTNRLFFARYGCFNANAHLIPRHCFDKVGGFADLKTTQDNHMWFRLSEYFFFKRVPEVLMKYRHHPSQDSRLPQHVNECNKLYTFFTESLTDEYIHGHVEKDTSVAEYHMLCAFVRHNRGYKLAKWYSMKRALKAALKHPIQEKQVLKQFLGLVLRFNDAPKNWNP